MGDNDSAPGFRFYPTEEELVSFYLQNKLNGTGPDLDKIIPIVDVYSYNPWDLPQFAGERCPADNEQWFFFTVRQEREIRGGRPNRLTAEGYWKATGSPGEVHSSQNNRVIGKKKTMVFYMGRAPSGIKTEWKMNEYKAFDHSINYDEVSSSSSSQLSNYYPLKVTREELSLCRIYKSRCLRGFDRRPPPEPVAGGEQMAAHHQPQQYEFNYNEQPLPNTVPVQTTDDYYNMINDNPDRSEINNTSNPPQFVEGVDDNWDIETDFDQPLWDWNIALPY